MADVTATYSAVSKLNIHDVDPDSDNTSPSFTQDLNTNTEDTDSDTASLDFEYESSDDDEYDRPKERWAPLGAAVSPTASPAEPSANTVGDRLHKLEEEQEQLNSSLLALTTHFAQVQFRLKQIINAEPTDREDLLKDLEDFAFKGIPDVRGCRIQDAQLLEELSEKEHEERMKEQREKQRKLITQLKSQLEDLETYAYESGQAEELPTSQVLKKQKVLLEEMRNKLHIDLQNFDKLNTEELKEIVDNAIGSIVNPAKVKEKLVDQLKTQVVDLERFILFLQGETDNPGPYGKQRCTCSVHHKDYNDDSDGRDCCGSTKARTRHKRKGEKPANKPKGTNSTATELMKKMLTVLQIYIFSQLGCGGKEFKQNLLKKTTKGNHWGDLRARLEVAITRTVELAEEQQEKQWQKDCCSDSELTTDTDEMERMSSPAVTLCVRKDLAMAIRDLMQHGLMEMSQNSAMVRFGCFSGRSLDVTSMMHAWDLLTRFYDMKHGREYNESPARMLSQSFHLDMVGGKPITAKQTLLGAIDTVLKSHVPHKRGQDSYFKAFICHALNERKLVTWLRLLFRTQTLIDQYYQDWSYVAHTGFEDALQSLERLLVINFRLPVDLSVRHFNSIHDAF